MISWPTRSHLFDSEDSFDGFGELAPNFAMGLFSGWMTSVIAGAFMMFGFDFDGGNS